MIRPTMLIGLIAFRTFRFRLIFVFALILANDFAVDTIPRGYKVILFQNWMKYSVIYRAYFLR